MPVPLAAIGLATGIIGGIGKIFGRGKANRRLEKLMQNDPLYKANPIAGQRMALARQLLNARSPGAAQVERNIYKNQANQLGQLQRNATDSSQLLALGAGAIGQSNQAFNELGLNEAQDYQRRYGNLVGAQEGMINEQDKVYQDKIRRFQNQLQSHGVQNANRQANWGDISSMGFGLMNFGMGSGMNNLFGGGGQRGRRPTANTTYYNGYTPDSDYGEFNTPY